MKTPLLNRANIAASGRAYSSSIPLIRARGVSVTGRVKFHGSATGKAVVEIYYSPDGSNWDTSPFGSFDLAVSAGAEVQITSYVVVPEHGWLMFAIRNTDSSYALTWGKIWYSIQSYPDGVVQQHGAVLADQQD